LTQTLATSYLLGERGRDREVADAVVVGADLERGEDRVGYLVRAAGVVGGRLDVEVDEDRAGLVALALGGAG
jgi:hypothetical protein